MKNLKSKDGKIFYTFIYKVFANDFLMMNNYEEFAKLVQTQFILSPLQWDEVLKEWEEKENILSLHHQQKKLYKLQ